MEVPAIQAGPAGLSPSPGLPRGVEDHALFASALARAGAEANSA
jgi:hypothetical protein